MKALQYSYPRSGSTVVWNILEDLLSPENVENKDRLLYPSNVIKTHDPRYFKQFYSLKGKIKFYGIDHKCTFLVSAIRHPATNCLSFIKTGMIGGSQEKEEVTNETITLKLQNYIDHHESMLKQLKEKSTKKNTILFDYDQQIKPVKPIFNTLEEKLGILITHKEDKIKYFIPPTFNNYSINDEILVLENPLLSEAVKLYIEIRDMYTELI